MQHLTLDDPVRKSADGTSIDVDESAISPHEQEEDAENQDAEGDSEENENQIYYEPDEIENNYMKQKQD